jgi:predicted DCC family thiol-disulfide oxidoreductase YuxK
MSATDTRPALPTLLYDGECGVCRRVGGWVERSAHERSGAPTLTVRPIGPDPAALRALAPGLDIWDAYATIHVVMPDGGMRRGGEAVAEVLRRVPATRWFAWTFALGVGRFRPFQALLNVAYAILADVRPLFGCESCGTPSAWVRALRWPFVWPSLSRTRPKPAPRAPHFSALSRRNGAPTPAIGAGSA